MKKDERLEHLRVISCCFVILGHIANWYMREYPDLPLNSYICGLIVNGICRISVPVFFMISGALLLEQTINYKKSLKRTGSMLFKTIVWTLVFMVWDYLYLDDAYDLQQIFTTPIRVHFWFMYVMVGICLTTPLWQKLVSGDSEKLMYYFSVTFIAVMALTFVLNMLRMNITYEIPLLGNSCYAGYFIMGYVLRHYADKINIKKWICFAVLLLCITCTNVLTWIYTKNTGSHYETFSDFRSVFIGVSAMTIFYMAMKMKEPPKRIWVTALSKHSFNIYMIHVFFLDILQQNIDVTKVNAWWGTPVFFIFMLSLSFAFSWVFEKAKGKKITII